MTSPARSPTRRRVFATACGAHALHDGLTDTLFLLLPIWKTEFGLGYAAVAALRTVYTGAMAGSQAPAAMIAERLGGRFVLALGTALAGVAYLAAGASASLPALALALLIGGVGGGTLHPIGASLVARAYEGARSRDRLSTFNFAGDVGKMVVPAAVACLLGAVPWRAALGLLGVCAVAGAEVVRRLPPDAARTARRVFPAGPAPRSLGFPLLVAIGVIDSATRMAFLTFLPFLLQSKGAGVSVVGAALTLVFVGGAAGKLVCGFAGARIGTTGTVLLTEGLTAAGIAALVWLPLRPALALLPAVGIALNGTSSVLYGTVPELVAPERRTRAFSLFYTGTIGAGAIAPALYGALGDAAGVPATLLATATIVLATLPLALLLRPHLASAWTSRSRPGT